MKRRGPGIAALGLVLSSAAALAAPPKDPSGTFLTEDTRARIRLENCPSAKEKLCGYIVWMKPGPDDPNPKDIKNPDQKKRARLILGHQLIMGLAPNNDARYAGQIYNSEDGKSYDVSIWLEKPNELKVKGCLVAFLCSTQTWTRANDVAPGQLVAATGSPGGPVADSEWAAKVVPAAATGTPPAPQPATSRPKP